MKQTFSSWEPEVAAQLESAITNMPHVFLAMESWFIGILLYLITSFAQQVADSFNMQKRPALSLAAKSPPSPVLIALGIAGLLGFTGIEPLMHAGQAAGINFTIALPLCWAWGSSPQHT